MLDNIPPATRLLLLLNIGAYLLQQVFAEPLLIHFALWPWGPEQAMLSTHGVIKVGFEIWQLVSYSFLHGSLTHILFNMFALWMFGGTIERVLGQKEFLVYYFVCVIVAAVCHLLVVRFFTGGFFPTLGASGGVFGVLLAFGMFFPHERIMLIFPPIPLPAWMFVIGYGVIELFLGITGTQAGVAHFAHLGGMLGGYILIEYWRGKLPIKPQRQLMR